MSHTVASQLVRHDLAWLTPVTFKQSFEEALGGLPISARLQEYINDFAILVERAPKIVLLALNFDEHLVEEKRIAVALVGAP
jgi:hypothetical protein